MISASAWACLDGERTRIRCRAVSGSVWHCTIRRWAMSVSGTRFGVHTLSWNAASATTVAPASSRSRNTAKKRRQRAQSQRVAGGRLELACRMDHSLFDLVAADRWTSDRLSQLVCERRFPDPAGPLTTISVGNSTSHSREAQRSRTTRMGHFSWVPGPNAARNRSARITHASRANPRSTSVGCPRARADTADAIGPARRSGIGTYRVPQFSVMTPSGAGRRTRVPARGRPARRRSGADGGSPAGWWPAM